MSDEQKSFWGCGGLVLIALVVGLALRSQSLDQFLRMCGMIVIGIMALVWGLSSLTEDGCLNQLWGLFCGLVTLTVVISVGSFLITGDYDQAKKIASWGIGSATPTPVASVQAEPMPTATPTAIPTPRPTPTSTATPTPPPASALAPAPASTFPSDVPDVWSWLFEIEVPRERVTKALNEIWGIPAQEATKAVDELRVVREMVSDEGKHAAGLLIAVALERAEGLSAARTAYERVKDEAEDSPYATSAAFRLRFLKASAPDSEESAETEELNFFEQWWYSNLAESTPGDPEDIETIYKTIADEPEVEGWFLLSDRWAWDTTRRTALQVLVERWADKLSFRFFGFLRLKSPFPTPYAYMFALLTMTIGVKILTLPLYIRTARTAVWMRRLQPEIRLIQSAYSDDSMAIQRRLTQLYQEHGLSVGSGCAVLIVDLIFVIWALVAMSSFSPQLVLDGAKFWWIADVTQRDLNILLVYVLLSQVQLVITGALQQVGQQTGRFVALNVSNLVGNIILVSLAWSFDAPAYVFVFWALLLILGMLINGILTAIWNIVE